jgi:hypothetical protein
MMRWWMAPGRCSTRHITVPLLRLTFVSADYHDDRRGEIVRPVW